MPGCGGGDARPKASSPSDRQPRRPTRAGQPEAVKGGAGRRGGAGDSWVRRGGAGRVGRRGGPAGDDRSGMNREVHVRMCVQERLACSAGDKPAGAKVRSPVVRMAGWRETKTLKPIDEVSLRGDYKSPGRNESKRRSGLESD